MNRWLRLLLSAAATLLLFAIPLRAPLNIYDEGLALVGGLRVYHGEIPFRDYWAIYPPGQSYALAAVFRLAGVNVLSERLYDTLLRIALVVVVYFVASALLALPRLRWGPTLSIAVLLASANFYGYAVFPALLLAFVALLLFVRALQKVQPEWFLACGITIGLTALFRIDIAAYVGIAILFALSLAEIGQQTATQSWLLRLWENGRQLLGGALLLPLPIYGWLAWVGDIRQMVSNLLIFPATTFHAVRHLPYPALAPDWSRWSQRNNWLTQFDWTLGEWLRFYLPITIYLLAALVILGTLVRCLWRKQPLPPRHIYASAFLVLGCGLFVQAMSRFDGIHALPTSLPTILLLCWLVSELLVQRWWKPIFTWIPGILSSPAIVIYALLPFLMLLGNAYRFSPFTCYSTIVRASCVPLSGDQTSAVAAMKRLSGEREAVFVASATHDRIFVNDVSLYFLAERPIPTRYHELHPGVATTRPVQQEIINELQTNEVKWLFVVDWPNPNEPNDSAKSSGITDLDEYIHKNYQAQEQFGIYQLWQKKP